jgi:hypothetical protein
MTHVQVLQLRSRGVTEAITDAPKHKTQIQKGNASTGATPRVKHKGNTLKQHGPETGREKISSATTINKADCKQEPNRCVDKYTFNHRPPPLEPTSLLKGNVPSEEPRGIFANVPIYCQQNSHQPALFHNNAPVKIHLPILHTRLVPRRMSEYATTMEVLGSSVNSVCR